MLVVTVKEQGRLFIGSDIEVVVVKTSRGKVRLGVVAPPDVSIRRAEVQPVAERGVQS